MSTRDFLFQNAIHSGDLETIKRIYEEGGSNLIDLPSDINCCTPLMTASQNGRLDIVKYLVSLGASTNVQDRGGYTALMHGVVGGELDVVTYLVQQTVFPCDLLKLNNDNDCALDIARDQGFSEIEDLLASELNRFLSDPDAIAALSAKQEEEDAKRLELEKINELDPNLNGIYLICAKGLLPNLREYPVEELAVPNDDGLTPLMVATRHGKFVVLAYMIELKVPLDDRDNTGRTALMHAVERGHRRITQYLLIHGANLYDVNEERTMWDYATDSKHLHILDILDDWKLRFPPGENKTEQAPQSPNKNIAWNESANKIHEFEQDEDEDEEGGEEEADEEEEDEEEEEEEGTSASASSEPMESPSLKVAAASPLIPTVAGRSRVSLSVPAHLANKRLAATAALNSSGDSEMEEIEEAVTPLVASSSTVSSSSSSEKKDATPQPTQKKTQEQQPSKPIVETNPEITELPTFTSIDSPKPLEVKELTLEEFEAVESAAISAHEASATSISLNSTKPETPPPQPQPSPPNSSSTSASQPFRSGTTRGTSLPIPGNTGSTTSTTSPFPLVKSPSAGLPLPSTPMRTTGGTTNTTPTSTSTTPTSTSGTTTTPTPSVSSRISAAKLAFDQPTPSPTSGPSPNNPRSRVSMSVPASYIAKRAAKQEVALKAPDFEAPQPSPTHVKGKLSLSASAAMRQKVLSTKHQPDPPSPNESTTLPMKQTPVISPVIPSKSITAPAPTKTPQPLPFNPGPPPPDEDSDDDIIPLPATARTPSKSFSTSTSTSKNTTPLPPPSSNPPTNITSRSRISFVSPTKKAPPPPEPEVDEFLPPPPRPADDDDDIGPPPPNHEPPPEPYLPPPSSAPPSRSSSKKKSISSRQSMSSGSSSRKRLPIPDEPDMPPPPPPPEDEDDVPPPPPPPAQNGDDDPSPKKRSRFKSPPPGNRKKNRTKSADRTTKPKKIAPTFDTTTTTNSSSPFNLPELKVEDTKLDGKIETIPTKKSNSKKGKKKKEKKPKNEKELEKQRKKEELRLKIEQAKSVKVAEKQEKLKRKQQEKLEKEKKKNSKNSPSSPTYTEMQTEVMPVNDDDPIMVTRSSSTRKSISQFFTSLGRRSSAISPPPKSADPSAKKRSQSFSRLFTKSNS